MTDQNRMGMCLAKVTAGARLALVVSAASMTILSGCSEEEKTVDELLPSVSIHVVEVRTLDEEIRASGDLKARFHTKIAAEVDGRVTELAIDEGGSVDAGAIVIENVRLHPASAAPPHAYLGSGEIVLTSVHEPLDSMQ